MSSIGVIAPTIAASSASQNRALPRSMKLRMDRREELPRQQSIVGHRVEHSRLAQQHHQHHARQPGKPADGDDVRRPVQIPVQEGAGQRRFDIHLLPRHHARQHRRHADIEQRADQQRKNDPDRQIPLRILRLLRRRRHRVEADIREENIPRRHPDARETERRKAGPVGSPVYVVHIVRTQRQHKQHHRDLHHHDARIELGALADADHQDRRNHHRDQKGGQIKANRDPEDMRRIQQLRGLRQQIRRRRGLSARPASPGTPACPAKSPDWRQPPSAAPPRRSPSSSPSSGHRPSTAAASAQTSAGTR